jgi:hypothetical protein
MRATNWFGSFLKGVTECYDTWRQAFNGWSVLASVVEVNEMG